MHAAKIQENTISSASKKALKYSNTAVTSCIIMYCNLHSNYVWTLISDPIPPGKRVASECFLIFWLGLVKEAMIRTMHDTVKEFFPWPGQPSIKSFNLKQPAYVRMLAWLKAHVPDCCVGGNKKHSGLWDLCITLCLKTLKLSMHLLAVTHHLIIQWFVCNYYNIIS